MLPKCTIIDKGIEFSRLKVALRQFRLRRTHFRFLETL